MSIDDDRLLAFVDGELEPAACAEIERALAADPTLARRAARHRALRARVAETYAPVLDEPVPTRLMALVSADRTRTADLTAARARRGRPGWPAWAAMAASLVVGLAAGAELMRVGAPSLVTAGPTGLAARGALAHALDDQLASSGGAGPIRIGVSFLSTGRRYCRTFHAASARLAGLACRDPDAWRVEVAVAQGSAPPAGAYRMAASELPAPVLAAAQAMMAGEPLDAAGEAAAKAKRWRP